ncbi:MAG TPA: monofunctional biosynthetic peptidoglycan transglycosylase [Burkholderiaceae bacterium]|nr:monofunctional biosynthetic peptidoglycan transglycosylase [Burkholderiaceae bacterium]
MSRSDLGRWLGRIVLLSLIVLVAIQTWYLGWVVYWKWHNPATTAFMRHAHERLVARNPSAHLAQQWVVYSRISGNLKRAVVAAEDARFLEHEGVDWEAMQKAYEQNLRRGRAAHGGSTISQQLAKNLFLSAHRSYWRKAQELLITWMVEAVWNKRRILEVYLNVVEWGDGVFGAQAAARHYFGVDAASLSPEQAAQMAAMLPAPRIFDHHRDAPFLHQRTDSILRELPAAQIP